MGQTFSDEPADKVRKLILDSVRPAYLSTNKMEISVRCPFCGDSRKSKSSAHLYISMKPPFMYDCKKCHSHGVLNEDLLRRLSIYSSDAAAAVIEADKSARTKGVSHFSFKSRKLEVTSEPDRFSAAKKAYFDGRYGMDFDIGYISEKYHAVLNSESFFGDNHIWRSQAFDFDHAIGFVSADNSCVIFRDITGQQPKRYFNLTVDQDNPNSSKIYNIASKIDILSDEVNLIMAEGIFDIIGVYEFFYKGKVDESKYIFAAVCGKDYDSVIRKYVRMGFLNLKVSIYSDSDVDVSYFAWLKKNSIYLQDAPLEVYYNTIEKDYGIPKDRISLRKAIL